MAEQPKHNIVQAEFFFEDTVQKRSIRFYDTDGRTSELVKEYERFYQISVEANKELFRGLRGSAAESALTDARNSQIAMQALRKRAKLLVSGCLIELVNTQRNSIAIEECYVGPLRFATREEMPQILEWALAAKDLWLFVFEPNDLCADSNKSVAHMTF